MAIGKTLAAVRMARKQTPPLVGNGHRAIDHCGLTGTCVHVRGGQSESDTFALSIGESLMHGFTIGKTPDHTSRTLETFGIWGHDAHGILFSCLVSCRCPMNVRLRANRSDCAGGERIPTISSWSRNKSLDYPPFEPELS
jgi:hypothetical protein